MSDSGNRRGGADSAAGATTVTGVALAGDRRPGGELTFLDGDRSEVALDAEEAATFFALIGDLDDVTVSACPSCRSRILAAVALVDLLDAAPPHPRASELVELAEAAPTLHVYLVDAIIECAHDRWLDPGYDEWAEAVDL
jgi:hypothetical protein